MKKILQSNAVFFCCDIQNGFMKTMADANRVKRVATCLTKASTILKIPMIVTEQYPKYFGPTISEILENASDPAVFEKFDFSMCIDPVMEHLKGLKRKQIVLFGIEAHVCVLQSALDLNSRGYDVFVVADGVASQRVYDQTIALERMKRFCALTTVESVLFELIGSAKHIDFKAISKLCIELHKESDKE